MQTAGETWRDIFDGVFTKLAAWALEDYAKVLLLDLDVIPPPDGWP